MLNQWHYFLQSLSSLHCFLPCMSRIQPPVIPQTICLWVTFSESFYLYIWLKFLWTNNCNLKIIFQSSLKKFLSLNSDMPCCGIIFSLRMILFSKFFRIIFFFLLEFKNVIILCLELYFVKILFRSKMSCPYS